jgi:hypothetical protein
LTHPDIDPDLWLEDGSFGEPDRKWVYGLFNTTTENLWTTLSVLIVGCLQSILSIQTPKFMAMLDQRVQDQMTHFNDKYKRLAADYEELR